MNTTSFFTSFFSGRALTSSSSSRDAFALVGVGGGLVGVEEEVLEVTSSDCRFSIIESISSFMLWASASLPIANRHSDRLCFTTIVSG